MLLHNNVSAFQCHISKKNNIRATQAVRYQLIPPKHSVDAPWLAAVILGFWSLSSVLFSCVYYLPVFNGNKEVFYYL